jgi:hypothetical protein
MAREPTITYEDVASAVNHIKSNGGKPSARNVRESLGRGSMATVVKLLRMLQGRQISQSQVSDEILDQSVTSAINSYITGKIQEATTAFTMREAELQSDADMLIGEYERQTEELTTQADVFSELQERHAVLNGRVQQLQSDAKCSVSELFIERQAAESARVALAKAELRLEVVPRMETELNKVRAELLEARTQSALFSEAAAVAKAKYEAELEHRRRA